MSSNEVATTQKKIQTAILILDGYLEKEVTPEKIGTLSKIPYKAFVISQTTSWRVREIAAGALDAIEKENWLSAIILTRSLMETVAVQAELARIIENTAKRNTTADADKRIMRLLLGQRIKGREVESLNILTLIDEVSKTFKNFRNDYDYLSEYAHPNWNGVLDLFAITKENSTLFKRYARGTNEVTREVFDALEKSLGVMVLAIKKQMENNDDFSRVCDEEIID